MHATSNARALSHKDMRAHMHASLFCLAPTGSGWGVRLKFALLSGCIPVIIDDHVRVRSLPHALCAAPDELLTCVHMHASHRVQLDGRRACLPAAPRMGTPCRRAQRPPAAWYKCGA